MNKEITMTTVGGKVCISVDGTGTATINWGDGSENETYKFIESDIEGGNIRLSHQYIEEIEYTITITGDNITGLFVNQNNLTSLDVSKCTTLTHLDCDYNQLIKLDMSQNTALTQLECACNSLRELDVSQNTALTQLECYYNLFTELDVSQNTALKRLDCGNGYLKTLIINPDHVFDWLCVTRMVEHLDVSTHESKKMLICGNIELTLEKEEVETEEITVEIKRGKSWITVEYEKW